MSDAMARVERRERVFGEAEGRGAVVAQDHHLEGDESWGRAAEQVRRGSGEALREVERWKEEVLPGLVSGEPGGAEGRGERLELVASRREVEGLVERIELLSGRVAEWEAEADRLRRRLVEVEAEKERLRGELEEAVVEARAARAEADTG